MKKRKYTDIDLEIAVRSSTSVNETLRKLGIRITGGMHSSIRNHIKEIGLNTDHFKGQSQGRPNGRKFSLDDILKQNTHYSSKDLKNRLIKERILDNICINGHPAEWMGEKLTLHLDHINGNNTDNRIENLRLLCPNCHSQTETYSRGMRRKMIYSCMDCGIAVSRKSRRCAPCNNKASNRIKSKIIWPDANDLFIEASNTSYTEVGKRLGVTDTAVRKRLKKFGYDTRKYKMTHI